MSSSVPSRHRLTADYVEPLAPTWEDPVPAGASRLIGGRWGRHADGPTSWWWTPLRVALACTILVVVFGYLQKTDCFGAGGYQNEHQYTRLCYSDTYALYTAEGLNARTNKAGEITGKTSIPYRDHPVEYPPVIGGLMWAAAEVTVFVHPSSRADVGGAHNQTFFNVTALGLAVCALISTWTIANLAGRRRAWDAMMVALSPVLFMYAFTNWDLAAVAFDRARACGPGAAGRRPGPARCSAWASRRSSTHCSCCWRC